MKRREFAGGVAAWVGGAGLAGAAVLAGCSSGTTSTNTGMPGIGGSAPSSKPSALLAIFDNSPAFSRAGVPQRLAFALGGGDGAPTKEGPEQLEFRITNAGKPVGDGGGNLHPFPPGDRARMDPHSQGLPLEQFHDRKRDPLREAKLVDGEDARV